MNTLQLAPLGVTTPSSGPTGVSPVGEASPTPATAPQPSTNAAQQQRLAEARATTARAAASRKAQAEAADEAPAAVDSFDRKVGLVDGTFEVFVDLVKPPGDEAVFRLFGPSEHPAPPPQPRTSAAATNAYTRGPAVPLKDLGIA